MSIAHNRVLFNIANFGALRRIRKFHSICHIYGLWNDGEMTTTRHRWHRLWLVPDAEIQFIDDVRLLHRHELKWNETENLPYLRLLYLQPNTGMHLFERFWFRCEFFDIILEETYHFTFTAICRCNALHSMLHQTYLVLTYAVHSCGMRKKQWIGRIQDSENVVRACKKENAWVQLNTKNVLPNRFENSRQHVSSSGLKNRSTLLYWYAIAYLHDINAHN